MSKSASSSSSSSVPPNYPKFGKSVRDLFKKKYEFDNQFKTINKSSRGVTLEAGGVLSDSGNLRGFLKGKYPVKGSGEGEWEISTDANTETKGNFKFNELAKGLTVNVLASSKDKNFKKPIGGVEFEYGQENVAATLTAKSDLDTHRVEASIAAGSNGFTVGASAVLDLSHGASLRETNVGAEYAASDFTATVHTDKNRTVLNAGYYQKVGGDHVVGALFKQELHGKEERSLTVGNEFRLDALTMVRSKIELPSGDVSVAVEHRLPNPQCLLSVAAQFNARSGKFQADKLGVGITLGDY